MIGMWVRLSVQGFKKNVCVYGWCEECERECVCVAFHGGYSQWIARSISGPSVPADVCVSVCGVQ